MRCAVSYVHASVRGIYRCASCAAMNWLFFILVCMTDSGNTLGGMSTKD